MGIHCVSGCGCVLKQEKCNIDIGLKQGGGEREREQFNGSSCCHHQDIHGNIGSSLSNYFTHKQGVSRARPHTHIPVQALSNNW